MFDEDQHQPLSGKKEWAIATEVTSAMGYELAKCCAKAGFHLVIAANDCRIHRVATKLMRLGVRVETVEADLTAAAGVIRLYAAANGKSIAWLFAHHASRLDQAFANPNAAAQRGPNIVRFMPDDGQDPARMARRIFHIALYGRDTLANTLQQRVVTWLVAAKERLSDRLVPPMPLAVIRARAPFRSRPMQDHLDQWRH